MSGSNPLLKFIAFSAVCIAFAAWLVVTIGNIALFADRVTYEAVVGDATGLVKNDAVKIAGVEVGKVESIHVERGNAVVRFSLREDVELGEETTIGVRWRNLLGLRYLYVYPAGEETLDPGHRFPLSRTIAVTDFGLLMQRLVPVQRALDPEVGNTVVRALNEAIAGREDRIQRLIAEAGNLTHTLADREDQIGRVLENGAELAQAYAEREQALRDFLDRFADVSETIAGRNAELERIIVDVADAQAELSRFLEANDEEIHGLVDGLDDITTVLSVNRSNLEDVVTHLGRGLAFYHRTSRWGQWFNVRVAGTSGYDNPEETLSTERGACLPERIPPEEQEDAPTEYPCFSDDTSGGPAPGAAGFFRAGSYRTLDEVTGGDG